MMMKQNLRNIFLLLALFMATANVWADCVIFSDNGPYEMMTSGSKSKEEEFTISNPRPCNQLKFTNTYGTAASGNVILTITYSDGTNSGEIKKGKGTHTIELERKIVTKLHFKGGGFLKKTLSAITLTQATYVDAPQGFTNNAWSAGTDIVGNSAQKTATIAWSDATFTWELLNNTDNQFSASFSSTGATCTYGTSNITVTYLRTKPGNHSATLKITASTGATYTIALSGVTGKYTPQAAKKMDMVMNESYNPSDIFDVYYYANNNKSTINDYLVTALDPTIANYVDGQIVTNYHTGVARFQLTREADTNFDALNTTISVNVNPAGGCLVLEPCSGSCYVPTGGDFIPVDLIGPADYLSFQARKETGSAIGNIEIKQYVNNEWKFIDDANPGTDWRDYGYTLDESATKVGFFTSTGSYSRYFQNVQVTRKTYLRPSVSSLALPQATMGKPVSASFDLSWSTCSDEIVLVSTNSNFVLNQYSIDATSGRGTTTITVTYDANSGSQSGTIFIYDQSQKIEISVSCEVKAKLTTKIIYTGNETYPNTPDGIPYPFYVKDENGNTVEGATITLETSNKDILSFDDDDTKIYPHCGGNVTLTATYAGDDTHEAASLSKTINVLDCNQKIIWEQDLRTYVATEEGVINETTLLAAVAANDEGEPTGTPIQYSLDAAAEEFADIVYNGDGTYSLRVHGVGKGIITASAVACTFEDEQYVAAQTIREIRVRKNGDPCDTYALEERNELYLEGWSNDTKVLPITGLPDSRMEFYAHVDKASVNNYFYVKFSTDNQATWSERQTFNIKETYDWSNPYVCTVPENSTHVHFETVSSLNTYFNCITIRQKTYITPSVNEIIINNAVVNQEFTYTFTVDYSDVPLIQYAITNNNNLNLKLTPSPEIHNDCGEHGKYTFTLTGTSLFPQTNVNETITISTTAKHHIEIPITITSTLAETYYFQTTDGNWSTPGNWTVNSQPATSLPTASNPVVITKNVTVDNQAVAYSVEMQDGAHIKIASTGGLTVHAGGYTTSSQEPDLEITIDKEHAGYFRMYPNSLRTKSLAAMPQAKVNFTTRGNMNNGGNKDATWQYIGAPGSGVGMDLAHTTVLYLRSEEKGWVRQYTEWAQLTPFAGYALTQKEQETFTLYPQLLNENITISLTYTENGMEGDNLWANSYMAPLDITKFTPEDFSGEVERTFYLYNSGSWNLWDANQDATTDATVTTPGRYYAINQAKIDQAKDQTVIPPMQGVYMKAKLGGGSITLNYEKHVWNNTQTARMNTPLRVAGKEGEAHTQSLDFQRVRLQVNSENSGADRMYIIQDSMATAGYDNGYDAPKLMADGLVNIYTNEPFGKMEISSTDHMDGMYIGFQAGEDTHYIMTFTSLVGDSLYLYDLEEDKFIEMQDGEQYHFSAMAQSTNDMRFQLLVAPTLPDETPGQGGGVTTDVENITTPQLWVSDRKVFVSNAKINSTMAIYTASGMLITAPCTLHTTPYTLDLSYLPTGVYVLRLNDQAYKFVCK